MLNKKSNIVRILIRVRAKVWVRVGVRVAWARARVPVIIRPRAASCMLNSMSPQAWLSPDNAKVVSWQ